MDILQTHYRFCSQDKADCLADSISGGDSGNLLETLTTCNMSQLIQPLYDTVKSLYPLWKNSLLVIQANRRDQFQGN